MMFPCSLLAYGETQCSSHEQFWVFMFSAWFVSAAIQGIVEGYQRGKNSRRQRWP